MIRNRLKKGIFLALLTATGALASSCAYDYAGQESKAVAEKEPVVKPEVVELEGAPTSTQQVEPAADSQPADSQQTNSPQSDPQQAEPSSPCGVESFTIARFTPEGRVAKTIDCVQRKVVRVEREPMGHSQLVEARQAGLPEGTWYLLVDPKGLRAKFLSNAELIELSKQFEVEYVGKDRRRNLAIYEYRDVVR